MPCRRSEPLASGPLGHVGTDRQDGSFDRDAYDAVSLHQRIERGEPRDHMTKHGVMAIEVRLRRVCEKVLAAARIGARQRHAYGATVVIPAIELIPNSVPGTAVAVATWVAILGDKIRNDPMKDAPVVVPAAREAHEVSDSERRVLPE